MLLDALVCPNCGAALPAGAAAGELVTCQYCKTSFHVPASLTPEPALGDLLLGADFSHKPVAGWEFPNEDNIRLVAGTAPELRAQFPPSDMLHYVLKSAGYFDNVDVSVTIVFHAGELKQIDAGISVRYQKGIGSYAFLISPIGTYTVGYYVPGDGDSTVWKSFVPWSDHSAVHTGLEVPNRLRVVASGDRLRVYINGVLATSLHDKRYEAGEVLLDAESSTTSSVEVAYTDLQVREVQGP